MRITSRALLCATVWRVGGNLVDTGFDDLRELCATAGDTASLALGTAGQLLALTLHHRYRESSRLAAEYAGLIERIDDPTMRVRVLPQVIVAQYEAGAIVEALQLSERVIDLAEGEAVRQNLVYRTALARATMMRGLCRCALGRAGWRTDLDEAITMARGLDPGSRFLVITYIYGITVANLLPDTAVMRGTAEALEIAARSGQDFALLTARWVRGLVLCHGGDPHRAVGLDLLVAARQTALQQGYPTAAVPIIDIEAAREKLRLGDIDGAVKTSRKRSTTSWTTAGCCGTDQQSPFWLKHYSLAVVSRICERRRTPSTDSTECRPIQGSCSMHSRCCGCGRCWPPRGEMMFRTATIGTTTAQWRHRWASRGIWSGPRQCHDGGLLTLSRNRPHSRRLRPATQRIGPARSLRLKNPSRKKPSQYCDTQR